MEIDIDMRSQVPSYRQLADQIRSAIDSGEYGPDDPIPSLRDLQQRSGLAMATVQHAIRVLADDGLVVSVPGRGTFVRREGSIARRLPLGGTLRDGQTGLRARGPASGTSWEGAPCPPATEGKAPG